MKIAYLTDQLTIHDWRFLDKLTQAGHAVHVLAYSNAEVPERIRRLDVAVERIAPAPVRWLRAGLRGGARGVLAGARRERVIPRRPEPWAQALRLIALRAARRSVVVQRLMGTGGWPPAAPVWLERYARASVGWRPLAELRRALERIRPDLLHAGWVQSCGVLAGLSRFRPLLLMPWGSDILLLPQRSAEDRALARFAIGRSDAITCDCEALRRELIELYAVDPARITVFPWGVDLRRFQPRERGPLPRGRWGWGAAPVALMTRGFKAVYGVDTLLRAWREVRARMRSARLVLLGDGPQEAELRALAVELELGDGICFAGVIPHEQLPEYYNAADLYVSASLSDGSSLSLLEAMACGLAAVVSDVPANREWIEDGVGGRVVARAAPAALSAAILELLSDGALRQAMGRHNLAVARARADWDRNYLQLESIYSRLTAAAG